MFKVLLFDASGVIYERPEEYDKGFFKKIDELTGFKGSKTVFDLLSYDYMMNDDSRRDLFRDFFNIIQFDKEVDSFLEEYERIKREELFLKQGVKSMLESLQGFDVKLGILSNGMFTNDEKSDWLESLGVLHFFDFVFTSKSLGYTKIYRECMSKVLNLLGCEPNQVLMVGHEYSDFVGAGLCGVRTLSKGFDLSTSFNVEDLTKVSSFLFDNGLIRGK